MSCRRSPRLLTLLSAIFFPLLFWNCGGGGDKQEPTEPSEPASQITTVTVSPDSAILTENGATKDFDATAKDQNGNTMSGVSFSWSVSDTSIATVDTDGTTTAKAEGAVTVEAEAGGVTGSSHLTVDGLSGAEILRPDPNSSITEGDTLQLQGEATDREGDSIPASQLTWRSDIDGELGSGRQLTVSGLTVETHWFVLSAETSQNRYRDSVTVMVQAAPDSIDRPLTAQDTAAGFRVGHIIINYANDPPADSTIAWVNRRFNIKTQRDLGELTNDYIAVLATHRTADSTRSLAEEIEKHNRIQYAAINPLARASSFPTDWSDASQPHLWRVGVDLLWERYSDQDDTYPGQDSDIAIIDTGIDPDHNEFMADQLPFDKLIQPAKVPLLGPVMRGFQFVYDNYGQDGHGTGVASIAGANGWNNGMTGVAPGSQLIPVKHVRDSIASFQSSVVRIKKAIAYAVDVGADVINVSLAVPPKMAQAATDILHPVVTSALDAGVQIVMGSGNCGEKHDSVNGLAHADDRIVVVGGTNRLGTDIFTSDAADYRCDKPQSQGGDRLDVLAPGYGTIVYAKAGGGLNESRVFGTSYAAPVVSGLIAVYSEADLSPESVREKLFERTVDLSRRGSGLASDGWDSRTGHGRVIAGIELQGLDPSTVSAGNTATIRATGRNLGSNSQVLIDGQPKSPDTVVNHRTIEFGYAAPDKTTTVPVSVRHPSGMESQTRHLKIADRSFAYEIDSGVPQEDVEAIKDGLTSGDSIFGEVYSWDIQETVTVEIRDSADDPAAKAGDNNITFNTENNVWTKTTNRLKRKISVHELTHIMQAQSTWDSTDGSFWSSEGTAEFLGFWATFVERGWLTQDEIHGCHVWNVHHADPPLKQLEEYESSGGQGPIYSLFYLAVELLLQSKEPADLDAFFETDWQQAVESIYGANLQTFYEDFAAERETWQPPDRYVCNDA